MSEHLEATVGELHAQVRADDLTLEDDSEIVLEGLAAVAEERGLDRDDLDGLADRVDDQRRQRLAVDVLGHDEQRLAGLGDLLEQREQVGEGADLLAVQQDQDILVDGLLLVGVGDEVGAEVALVEGDALGHGDLGVQALGFLDGHDAVDTHGVHGLGDHPTHLGVTGGDRGDLRHPLGPRHRGGGGLEELDDGGRGLLDALAHGHRVGSGGHVAQPLTDERLREHRRGGRAVTGHVVGLGGDALDQLGTEIRERLGEFDLAGDGDTVVGDGGATEGLGQHDVPTLRAERDLDGVGELVDTGEHALTGLLVERYQLGH